MLLSKRTSCPNEAGKNGLIYSAINSAKSLPNIPTRALGESES